MTKDEFDFEYRNKRLAVHMPNHNAAQHVIAYANALCGTHKTFNFSIHRFPYLMYLGGRSLVGLAKATIRIITQKFPTTNFLWQSMS